MKKNRIFALAALVVGALLLASCTITVDRPRPPVRNFTFESSWKVTGTNTWASCENRETIFEYSFYAENPSRIVSITEHYVGVETEETKSDNAPRADWDIQGNTVTVQAIFHANGFFLPLSEGGLSSQAIVPVPIPNDPTRNNGTTRFQVAVEYEDGITYRSPVTTVESYTSCPAN